MKNRGILTKEIKDLSNILFDEVISQDELRLMPYIQYRLVNDKNIKSNQINEEEHSILLEWQAKGYLTFDENMEILSFKKEFWDKINQIIWLGYVGL